MVGIIIKTFWYSYILTIIMLGGALVLFIYISRIASNEKINISIKIISIIVIIIIINILFILNYESIIFDQSQNIIGPRIPLIKIFSIQRIRITIILVSYLFITIIAINYIVNIYEGPLRKKY